MLVGDVTVLDSPYSPAQNTQCDRPDSNGADCSKKPDSGGSSPPDDDPPLPRPRQAGFIAWPLAALLCAVLYLCRYVPTWFVAENPDPLVVVIAVVGSPVAAPFREVFFAKRIDIGDEAPEPQGSRFAPNLLFDGYVDVIRSSDGLEHALWLLRSKDGYVWPSLVAHGRITSTCWRAAAASFAEPYVSSDYFDVRRSVAAIAEPIGKLRFITRIGTDSVIEQHESSFGECKGIGAFLRGICSPNGCQHSDEIDCGNKRTNTRENAGQTDKISVYVIRFSHKHFLVSEMLFFTTGALFCLGGISVISWRAWNRSDDRWIDWWTVPLLVSSTGTGCVLYSFGFSMVLLGSPWAWLQ